jgi:glutamate racemase
MTSTIGVFDSGFGGLTVLRALIDRLPQARYAFIGDTARLPYGSKSQRTIARYAVQSAEFLVHEQGAQFLVIACNTASALALDAIQQAVPVPVLGVIEPGAQAARAASVNGDVLVMATDATVKSHAYATACQALGLRALEKACPLLVPLVEEGWLLPAPDQADEADDNSPADASPKMNVTEQVIRIYLAELRAQAAAAGLKPDTLVLGCTHYPLLRKQIEQAVSAGVRVIDSAESTAERAQTLFGSHFGPATAGQQPELRFFATDSIEKFERLGSRFLGRPVGKVQLVDLGG